MPSRPVEKQRELLALLRAGTRVEEACEKIGISPTTFRNWKFRYPDFAADAAPAKAIGMRARENLALMDKVYDPDEWADPVVPPFRQFRKEFIGRPTPQHQEPLIEAWEDKTNRIVIYLGPPAPQPVSSTVYTPEGPIKLGDIRVGDLVAGPDGKFCRVTRVIPAGTLPVWEVETRDGSVARSASHHKWPIHPRGGAGERPLPDLLPLQARNRYRWRIANGGPVEYPARSVPIDPWLMGMLLGDGSFRQNTIKVTTTDEWVVGRMAEAIPEGTRLTHIGIHHRIAGVRRDPHNPGGTRSIMRELVEGLGLADHYATDKFIPSAYMVGSVEQRYALLRGLMDADGSADLDGGASLASSSPPLVRDVIELVRSLGGQAWVSYEDRREGRSPSFTVRIKTPRNPFSLPRKAERWRNTLKEKIVVDAREVGVEECVCITVDAPHHQYLTDGYLPTCNSGKDTTAGDMVLHESVSRGKRIAWVMESSNFSSRRLARLEGYYWDDRAYLEPANTPGSNKPTRRLFAEYGPFKWEKGMVYPDGTKVPQNKWTQNELYFLGRDGEADPNLWATGIEGAMYGARIDTAVLSDIFTEENQQSPARRDAQIGWVIGTFLSRLDDKGRALFLGTRVAEWDNWGRLIEELVGESPVLWEDGFTTKYANGVAVVIVPAIQTDEDGTERSYWPQRFPLRSRLVKAGDERFVDELSQEEHMVYAKRGYQLVTGLYDMRGDSPAKQRWFATAYQQNPPSGEDGEFPLALLNRCDDYERGYGQFKAGSTLVLGIDPAHRGGAAWVLWEWNGEQMTVIDWFFGVNIGVTGLREKLLVDPISQYAPRYAIYESNRESSVLEHPEVLEAAKVYRTEIKGVPTHAFNRGVGELRVAAMSMDMANGLIRFPAASQEDRRRSDQLKEQFLNWDARERMRKTDSQMRLHIPDDLAMAAWVGWVKLKQLIGKSAEARMPRRAVAPSVARSWGYVPILDSKSGVRSQVPTDLVSLYYGTGGE